MKLTSIRVETLSTVWYRARPDYRRVAQFLTWWGSLVRIQSRLPEYLAVTCKKGAKYWLFSAFFGFIAIFKGAGY